MNNKKYMVYDTFTNEKVFHRDYISANSDYTEVLDMINEGDGHYIAYLFKIEKTEVSKNDSKR